MPAPPPHERPTAQELAMQSNGGQGIACPRCGLHAWRVYYTRHGPGIVKRKRVCLTPDCEYQIVTHEKPIGQIDLPPPL